MGAGNRVETGLLYRPAAGYIGWRNSFLVIDSWASLTFKNTGSVYRVEYGIPSCPALCCKKRLQTFLSMGESWRNLSAHEMLGKNSENHAPSTILHCPQPYKNLGIMHRQQTLNRKLPCKLTDHSQQSGPANSHASSTVMHAQQLGSANSHASSTVMHSQQSCPTIVMHRQLSCTWSWNYQAQQTVMHHQLSCTRNN
jgi:hypothetical protein